MGDAINKHKPYSKAARNSGFLQSIWKQSATQNHPLGYKRTMENGDVYAYFRAGGTVVHGKLLTAAAQDAQLIAEVQTATTQVSGARTVSVLVTAGATIAANQLKGGYLTVDGPAGADGEGYYYRIAGNAALGSSGTSLTLYLDDPLLTAIAATDYISVSANPFYAPSHQTQLYGAIGVPRIDVTSGYFAWAQQTGRASVLADTNHSVDVGEPVIPSNQVAGAVEVAATIATDEIIGTCYGVPYAATNGLYAIIQLRITAN